MMTPRLLPMIALLAACESTPRTPAAIQDSPAGGDRTPAGRPTTPSACSDPSTEVVGHLKRLGAIATDGTSIYFRQGRQQLNRVPVTGGAVTTVTDKLPPGSLFAAAMRGQLAVDATTVYVLEDDTIHAIPKTGGEIKRLAQGAELRWLALDHDALYYSEAGNQQDGRPHGAIKKIAIAGGEPTVIADGLPGPDAILVDATHIYVEAIGSPNLVKHDKFRLPGHANDGGVMAIPRAGGAPRAMFSVAGDGKGTQTIGLGLIDDGVNIYFTGGNLEHLSAPSGMLKLPKAGGAATVFASHGTMAGFVAGDLLYELNGTTISKFALGSGARTELACLGSRGALRMTHDTRRIYFARSDSDQEYSIRALPL